MSDLVERLTNKVEVWGNVICKNELGEVDGEQQKIKSIWAEITCVSGSIKTSTGDVIQAEMKYKFTIRANAIKELKNDMYFKYKGQRYDIDYDIPNFKYKDSIEIYCSLVVE